MVATCCNDVTQRSPKEIGYYFTFFFCSFSFISTSSLPLPHFLFFAGFFFNFLIEWMVWSMFTRSSCLANNVRCSVQWAQWNVNFYVSFELLSAKIETSTIKFRFTKLIRKSIHFCSDMLIKRCEKDIIISSTHRPHYHPNNLVKF